MPGHKTIELQDSARFAWARSKLNLSKMWRRDAEIVRRKALKAERRAKVAVSAGWMRVKPKVVRVEHQMHDGLVSLMRRMRAQA